MLIVSNYIRVAKMAAVVAAIFCLIGLGYYLGKPKDVKVDNTLIEKVKTLEIEKNAANEASNKSLALANEIESQRLSLSWDRARQKVEMDRLRALVATQTKPQVLQDDSRDALIEKQTEYITGLESDKNLLTSENDLLRKSIKEKDIALNLSEEKFKAYSLSKDTQIAAMKSDTWKSNVKAFGLGFGTGLGVGLYFRLRF